MTIPKDFKLIAYRGGAGERPENTLAAFDHAVELSGQIVLDLDVQLTKDKQVVVLHDDTLERTTNGTGRVADMNYAQVRTLDAGFHFQNQQGHYAFRGQGLYIPLLEEVLERYSATVLVDIRTHETIQVDCAIKSIEAVRASDRIIMVSESDTIIKHCRIQRPAWKYAASTNETRALVLLNKLRLGRLASTKADYLMIPEQHNGLRVLDGSLLRETKRRLIPTWVWVVNTPNEMLRLNNLGVNGVFTEFPEMMKSLLNHPLAQ